MVKTIMYSCVYYAMLMSQLSNHQLLVRLVSIFSGIAIPPLSVSDQGHMKYGLWSMHQLLVDYYYCGSKALLLFLDQQ